jgi:hypothetical protein
LAVLCDGFADIDWLPLRKRQLAIVHRLADGARDGGKWHAI